MFSKARDVLKKIKLKKPLLPLAFSLTLEVPLTLVGSQSQTEMEGEYILIKGFMEGKRIKSLFNFGFEVQSWLVLLINKTT